MASSPAHADRSSAVSPDEHASASSVAVFDRYAATYDSTVDASIRASGETVEFFAQLKAELLTRLAASRIAAPRILDFGCGVGNLARAIAERWSTAHVVGCDTSPESVAHARLLRGSALDAPSFVDFRGDRVPFADRTFDIVCASCVFHHIEQDEHAHWVQELRRVLKPGGLLVLFEHNPYNPLTRRAVQACPFDEGVTLLAPRYAASLLDDGAFAAVETRFYFFFPAMLSALRPLESWLQWCPLGAQYLVLGVRDGQSARIGS